MPTKAVQAAINDQIAMELESAHVYLSMAAYFDENNLPGFSHWMRMQYQEELGHAMKLFDFMLDNGGHIVLKALAKPP